MNVFRTVSKSFLVQGIGIFGLTLGTSLIITPPAQAKLVNLCASSESTFLMAETKNYWLSICGGDLPHTYVGKSKRNPRSWVRAELVDYGEDGSYFDAVNRGYTYSINLDTAQGSWLSVTDGNDKEIVSEYLLDWE